MPFKSKAQAKKFAVMAAKGEIPIATLKKWASETKNYGRLPERKKKKNEIKNNENEKSYRLNGEQKIRKG